MPSIAVPRIDVDGTMFPRWEVELAELELLGVGSEVDQAEPSEADYRWAAENLELPPIPGPSDQDLEDMYLESLWQDRLEMMNAVTDEDIRVCGLAVG